MTQHVLSLRFNTTHAADQALWTYLTTLPAGTRNETLKQMLTLGLQAQRRATRQPPAPAALSLDARRLAQLSQAKFRLLEFLGWHPFLSAPELAQWLSLSKSFVRHTLRQFDAQALIRNQMRRVYALSFKYYTVTDSGIRLLASAAQQTFGEMKRGLGHSGFLEHTVECNGFFRQLHQAHPQGTLVTWHAEAGSRYPFPSGSAAVLRPDGYGEWRPTATTRRYPFFLEWDRHSGNPRKLLAKLRLYQRYYADQRAAGKILPRLLFVANDPTRAAQVREFANALNHETPYNTPLLLYLTTRSQLREQGPLAPIWATQASPTRHGPWA